MVTFAPPTGQTLTVGGVIADQTGSGGTGSTAGAGGIVVDGAGTVVLDAANAFTGGTTLQSGTRELLLAASAGAGPVAFGTPGPTETLRLDYVNSGATTVNQPIMALAGSSTSFIDLPNISNAGIAFGSYDGDILDFSTNGTAYTFTNLSIAAGNTINASDVVAGGSGTGVDIFASVLCFCANTLISTPSGERPVQELASGDMVTTHRGAARRIVWIGTGKVLATQGRRNAATPVIVCQSALADNVPNRDLRVTKGHSLYIDDVLIPVEFLVNHRSIFWDDNAQEVELYHIELERHDVLLANGAPAESYRDDGNRWLFRNANSGWGLPAQAPCAPVLTGGPIVDAAWRRLLDRAGPRPGAPTTDDPDLHLLVDGRRVDAASRSDVWHVFHLPTPPATMRIISRAGAPQEMGVARDPRCLGVALRRIMVAHGAQIRTIEAEDALLTDGFHGYEVDNKIRWTDGDAAMPVVLFEGFDGPLEIALRLGGRTSYPDEGTLLRAA